jgi:hypothetical protein
MRWASTLFPDGLWRQRARLPVGDVLGLAAVIAHAYRRKAPANG